MKYIKTNNKLYDIEASGGVYTITNVYDVSEELKLKYENTGESQQIGDKFVVIDGKDYKITNKNTSDDLEELSDCLVIKEFDFDHPFLPLGKFLGKFTVDSSWKKAYEEGRIEWMKLAIWTEEGLIYVANMEGILPDGRINWQLL